MSDQCCQKYFSKFRAFGYKVSEISATFGPNFGRFRAFLAQNFKIFALPFHFYCIFMWQCLKNLKKLNFFEIFLTKVFHKLYVYMLILTNWWENSSKYFKNVESRKIKQNWKLPIRTKSKLALFLANFGPNFGRFRAKSDQNEISGVFGQNFVPDGFKIFICNQSEISGILRNFGQYGNTVRKLKRLLLGVNWVVLKLARLNVGV